MKLGIAHTVNLEPLGARGSRHLRPVNNGTETSHMAKIQEDCVECCHNQTFFFKKSGADCFAHEIPIRNVVFPYVCSCGNHPLLLTELKHDAATPTALKSQHPELQLYLHIFLIIPSKNFFNPLKPKMA